MSNEKGSIAEKAYIVTTIAGVFALDEKNDIVDYKRFLKDSAKIAEKLKRSETETIEEERQLINDLQNKYAKIIKADKDKEQFVKENLRTLAVKHEFVKDQAEFNQILTKVNIALTKIEIKKAVSRDALIIQTNGAIEELDKSINILIERLREFYGLHFPEMGRAVADHERYAKLVADFGSRKRIDDAELKQLAEKSMGIELREEDVRALQELAARILELYDLRKNLESYLSRLLEEVAPNFRALAGPQIAAKLIAHAGGLDKLARMPSSTIQLSGAEKALFRHLHGSGKSPKHGIILAHPLMQNAPLELRGKIARLLASKLSIAAKVDYYSKEDRSAKMKKELEEKIKEVLKSK